MEAIENGYTVEGDEAEAAYREFFRELEQAGFQESSVKRKADKRVVRFDHPDGRVVLIAAQLADNEIVRFSVTVLTTEAKTESLDETIRKTRDKREW